MYNYTKNFTNFHTIQSILKRYCSYDYEYEHIKFPYYSVYFKAVAEPKKRVMNR